MLTFLLVVTVELIALFRLLIPRVLEFGEAKYNEVYGVSDAERSAAFAEMIRNFHAVGVPHE